MAARVSTQTVKPGTWPPEWWRSVKQRDRAADGKFVYAVRNTGVYCRPSCPSRKPSVSPVQFFKSPQDAERSGYRACRRCRPELDSLDSEATQLVQKVCEKIDRRLAEEPELRVSLKELEREFGRSSHQIGRAFRKILRITPRQYADSRRMAQLKSKLRTGEKLVTAMYDAGFGSSSRLYERAASQMGMTPATYRRKGVGMEIEYTIVASPLGRLLVAATKRGVSAVYLGDRDAELEKALAREYSKATIRRDAGLMGPWVRGIMQHLRGQEPNVDLPLDVQATAFQRRVWEELRRIPWGQTRTYTEVARAMGNPKAVRAVARACATNPVSVIVPCHRVVRADGNLAGYRWGLARKGALLAKEKEALSGSGTRRA